MSIECPKKLKERISKLRKANSISHGDRKLQRTDKILKYLTNDYTKPTKALTQPEYDALKNYSDTGRKVRPPKPTQADRVKALKAKLEERAIDLSHEHKIVFRYAKSEVYDIPNLHTAGSYWKYWLLNAKKVNGNGWGVSDKTIQQNIARFIGKPFVVTAKEWFDNSEYGTYEHPYVPTNHLPTIFNHQAKFTVGIIEDVYKDKNDDYYATIRPLPKFASRTPPPFCSPAIFQLDPHEPENAISKWEALHLAGLDRDPAYGAAIAMLKGTCIGTGEECKVQFHSAKQLHAGLTEVATAFKNKQTLKSGNYETDGKSFFLFKNEIARHSPKGLQVSNAGYDTATTYKALKHVGVDVKFDNDKPLFQGKPYNHGDFVTIPYTKLVEPLVTSTTSKPKKRAGFQTNENLQKLRNWAEIVRKRASGLSEVATQPQDQQLINSITGVKSPIPKPVRGTAAHHILYKRNVKGMAFNPNNGILLDRANHTLAHKLDSLKAKLQQRIAVVNRIKEKQRMKEGDPLALHPKEYAYFDETLTEGLPKVRVDTFGTAPEIEKDNKDKLTIPINSEMGSHFDLNRRFTSPLGEDIEEKQLNRRLLKERGQEETFGEHFMRKFGPGRFNTDTKESIHREIGTISFDNAKKYSKQKTAAYKIEQPAEVRINPEHGRTIADAYDAMKHEPNKPEVKEAYDSLINETGEQFKQLINGGLKITKMKPNDPNPYPTSKEMHKDIEENNHLYYFPTEQGFGQGENNSDHPMMRPTEFKHDGQPMLANDVFRIVHDINGHHLGGKTTFGPKGEHQAFIQHSKMYSPIAKKALFTETAGQNNWVNFSRSHGEKNRADPKNTTFAEQKAGLLPDEIINGRFHI